MSLVEASSEVDILDAVDVRMGQQLLRIRQDHGYRQRDVATVLGVSRSHLSNIESGRSRPGWHHLLGLSRYYRVSAEALMNDAAGTNSEHIQGDDTSAFDVLDDAKPKITPLDQLALSALHMLPLDERKRAVEQLVHRALHGT